MRWLEQASSFQVHRCILIVAVALVIFSKGEERIPDEQRLFEKIMADYESSARPTLPANSTLDISYTFRLNQIIDLDERKQILTTSVFLQQEWSDIQLKWDPQLYGGVRTIRAPAERVWLPDTYIFNNADDSSSGFIKGLYVLLKYPGIVSWPVPIKLQTTCIVDVRFFPFDRQVCRIEFGSWIYNSDWLRFQSQKNESVDLTKYTDNSEWILDHTELLNKIRPDRHTHYSVGRQSECVAVLNVRRRSFFYIWNVVVPCIMLTMLTLFAFWAPPASGEKITLGLSIFLAFSMFMLLIAEQVPPTSESVPLIGVYLTTVMSMTAISVIMGVMVVNLDARGDKLMRAPLVLRWFCVNILARVLCIHYDIRSAAIKNRVVCESDSIDGDLDMSSTFECHLPTREERMETLSRRISLFRYYFDKLQNPSDSDNIPPSPQPRTSTDSRRLSNLWFRQSAASDLREESSTRATYDPVEDSRPPSPVWMIRNSSAVADQSTSVTDDNSGSFLHHLRTRMSYSEDAEQRHRAKVDADPALADMEELSKQLGELTLITAEWRVIAHVIDRFMFWLFLIATVLAYSLTFTMPDWDTRGNAHDHDLY